MVNGQAAETYDDPIKALDSSYKNKIYDEQLVPTVITENSNLYNITDQFVDFLQKKIKENPSEYLWTHNRFKYKDLYSKFNQKS